MISTYHSLIRQREQLRPDEPTSAAELAELEEDIEDLGGLAVYQAASMRGHSDRRFRFNTSKWVVQRLSERGDPWRAPLAAALRSRRQRTHNDPAAATALTSTARDGDDSHSPPSLNSFLVPARPSAAVAAGRPRLLDVGAMTNHYLPWAHLMDVLAIDLHPQHPSVLALDFFHLPFSSLAQSFDAVVLSLVLNFVPSVARRGVMLRRASALMKVGGALFVVLPAACLANSRWVDEGVMRELLSLCGVEVVGVRESPRLVLVEGTKVAEPGRRGYRPKLVRRGASHNNFSISMPEQGESEAEEEDDETAAASDESIQRAPKRPKR